MRLRLLLLALAVALGPACEPPADDFDFERQEVPVFERAPLVPPTDPAPRALKVMAWNVKYGAARIDFWFDHWGDRVQMTETEVHGNLAAIERLIAEYDPDVLLAEEIEVGSKRSAYVDMVEHVLAHGRLNYAAYFQTWASRFVPTEGLGRVDLGNAIFSKYPITFAERIRQPDRTDQSALTRTFYIHRAIGRAVLRVGAREVAVFVVHTEAYDNDGTKQAQIAQIHDLVAAEPRPWVVGGDFNELPPTALAVSDFDDEAPEAKGTEFEQPPYTPAVMRPFFDEFVPAIPLPTYGTTPEAQRRYFTHTVLGPGHRSPKTGQPGFWNRTLDHLFASKGSTFRDGDVLQTAGRQGIASDPLWLSDHAPVVGVWGLPP